MLQAKSTRLKKQQAEGQWHKQFFEVSMTIFQIRDVRAKNKSLLRACDLNVGSDETFTYKEAKCQVAGDKADNGGAGGRA